MKEYMKFWLGPTLGLDKVINLNAVLDNIRRIVGKSDWIVEDFIVFKKSFNEYDVTGQLDIASKMSDLFVSIDKQAKRIRFSKTARRGYILMSPYLSKEILIEIGSTGERKSEAYAVINRFLNSEKNSKSFFDEGIVIRNNFLKECLSKTRSFDSLGEVTLGNLSGKLGSLRAQNSIDMKSLAKIVDKNTYSIISFMDHFVQRTAKYNSIYRIIPDSIFLEIFGCVPEELLDACKEKSSNFTKHESIINPEKKKRVFSPQIIPNVFQLNGFRIHNSDYLEVADCSFNVLIKNMDNAVDAEGNTAIMKIHFLSFFNDNNDKTFFVSYLPGKKIIKDDYSELGNLIYFSIQNGSEINFRPNIEIKKLIMTNNFELDLI
jgi:hypothetical protein